MTHRVSFLTSTPIHFLKFISSLNLQNPAREAQLPSHNYQSKNPPKSLNKMFQIQEVS